MCFDQFQYKNECYKQLERKTQMKKWGHLSSSHVPFPELWSVDCPKKCNGHGNQTNDLIFFIYFFRSNCLKYLFLNLKIFKIHFRVVPHLVHSGLQNTSIFHQKLPIQTAHHTFLESRHPEVTKNLYYVLPTRGSQIPIFLGSSSWTIIHVQPFELKEFQQNIASSLR